jgi:two-component system, NarL family, response regulator YdfI
MIRVAIIAESARLRNELGDVLRGSGRFEVIASLGGLDEFAVSDAEAVDQADVVLIEGGTASSTATKTFDDAQAALVLLSDDDELLSTLRPFRTGIALLPAAATADQIIAATEAAAAGLLVLHADHAGALTLAPAEDPLTPREREVLHMLAAGLGNKEIAVRLGISDHTAKFHVSQILAKLAAASRAEAVSIGMRRGLVPL